MVCEGHNLAGRSGHGIDSAPRTAPPNLYRQCSELGGEAAPIEAVDPDSSLEALVDPDRCNSHRFRKSRDRLERGSAGWVGGLSSSGRPAVCNVFLDSDTKSMIFEITGKYKVVESTK